MSSNFTEEEKVQCSELRCIYETAGKAPDTWLIRLLTTKFEAISKRSATWPWNQVANWFQFGLVKTGPCSNNSPNSQFATNCFRSFQAVTFGLTSYRHNIQFTLPVLFGNKQDRVNCQLPLKSCCQVPARYVDKYLTWTSHSKWRYRQVQKGT